MRDSDDELAIAGSGAGNLKQAASLLLLTLSALMVALVGAVSPLMVPLLGALALAFLFGAMLIPEMGVQDAQPNSGEAEPPMALNEPSEISSILEQSKLAHDLGGSDRSRHFAAYTLLKAYLEAASEDRASWASIRQPSAPVFVGAGRAYDDEMRRRGQRKGEEVDWKDIIVQ